MSRQQFLDESARLRDFLGNAHDPDLLPDIRAVEIDLAAREILRLYPLAIRLVHNPADPIPPEAQTKCLA